jgi:hypothetical protein
VEILRELYVENSGKAASAFRHMITNKQLSNRAAAIFLILYKDDDHGYDILNIICNEMSSGEVVGALLANSSLTEDMAMEIFKKLFAYNRQVAMSAAGSILRRSTEAERMVRILLELYGNNKDDVLDMLCDEDFSNLSSGCLLMHHSLNDDMAMEIFKELFEREPEKAAKTLDTMEIFGSNRANVIFLQMSENCEDAAKILLSEKIRAINAGFFLSNAAISPERMAEILIAALSSDAAAEMVKKSRIAHILDVMYSFGGRQEKVVAALRQMDQSVADSLLSMDSLSRYAQIIRAHMWGVNKSSHAFFDENMQCYEKEFIANFQSAITGTAVEETENHSDGEDSLIGSEVSTPDQPGWLRRIFTETVVKVLGALAVAAGSGLALWAITLWPLATCIGAGCAVIALAAVAFFRNRNANERKALEMDSSISNGVDLPGVVDI